MLGQAKKHQTQIKKEDPSAGSCSQPTGGNIQNHPLKGVSQEDGDAGGGETANFQTGRHNLWTQRRECH